MPTTNHLICYLGRNGSGKSYRANLLVKDQNYVKVSMADALRELAWKSLGWRPKSEEEYNEFKNCYLVAFDALNEAKRLFSIACPALVRVSPIKSITFHWQHFGKGREYLKNLGEGCKDLFGEDFWVKQWENKYHLNHKIEIDEIKLKELLEIDPKMKKLYEYSKHNLYGIVAYNIYSDKYATYNNITTDDIRFPIEVESAHNLGATFIWCDYQKGEYNNDIHSSEALANSILTSGKYTDGDEIEYNELKTFF